MAGIVIKTIDGKSVSLSSEALDALRGGLRGELSLPGEAGYDEARTIWNAMIDRRPAAIVRAVGASDVIQAVRLAARARAAAVGPRRRPQHRRQRRVRRRADARPVAGCGSVRVDPQRAHRARRARRHARRSRPARRRRSAWRRPSGINSTTGVAGLTLGGGFGWLSRKHGLTIDNLLSADVVTADGRAGARERDREPGSLLGDPRRRRQLRRRDLVRVPAPPGGPAGARRPHRPSVLGREGGAPRATARLAAKAPDELCCWVVMRKAPPLPFLPPEVHGTEVARARALSTPAIWRPEQRPLAPLKALGKPIADVVGPASRTPAGRRPSIRCSRPARGTTGSRTTSSSSPTA